MSDAQLNQLTTQLRWYWDASLQPRWAGLTDDEYFWEPVAGCWTVRPNDAGGFSWDWSDPAPDPPPLTTIAWRLCHIGELLLARANHHFADRSHTLEAVGWPGNAEDALEFVQRGYDSWMAGLAKLDDLGLQQHSAGPPNTLDEQFPFAEVILHVNREVIHHGSEVCLLRDLFRAKASPSSAATGSSKKAI